VLSDASELCALSSRIYSTCRASDVGYNVTHWQVADKDVAASTDCLTAPRIWRGYHPTAYCPSTWAGGSVARHSTGRPPELDLPLFPGQALAKGNDTGGRKAVRRQPRRPTA
jgi:hypothetical protein